jgi:predicted phosphodiesterase
MRAQIADFTDFELGMVARLVEQRYAKPVEIEQADAELQLDGRRTFATHYPHYGRGIACTGDYDVVCCGHSHRASIDRQRTVDGGASWLVNPGSVAGLGAPPTWILADLAGLAFEIREIGSPG